MIKLRKKNYIRTVYWIFLLCMVAALVLFIVRVGTRCEVTEMSVGQVLLSSKDYVFGTILDRNGELVVSGNDGGLIWNTDQTQDSFRQVLGTEQRYLVIAPGFSGQRITDGD